MWGEFVRSPQNSIFPVGIELSWQVNSYIPTMADNSTPTGKMPFCGILTICPHIGVLAKKAKYVMKQLQIEHKQISGGVLVLK